ncbi:unnamed protein product [Arabis nemorensis]|uniref:Uncharacterized protein n=1 Tax=Arabis nemorensis TaxID=586526 RepID=A0A565BMB0_9BRAS|nr:unnamed protein product [Arabis nemorensis]
MADSECSTQATFRNDDGKLGIRALSPPLLERGSWPARGRRRLDGPDKVSRARSEGLEDGLFSLWP